MADQLQLEYLYANQQIDIAHISSVIEIPLPSLDKASRQAILQLREALLVLDTEKVLESINIIRINDEALAEYLRKIADDLDYSALIEFIEGSQPND
jgi:hypothetical protein